MDTRELRAATPEKTVRLGRYTVVGLLGVGGMGDVYEAIDEEHGTRVALKTLRKLDPDRLLLFKNEFRAVAGLFHKNLVPLYELSYHDGDWFFTMERVEGVPLPVWLRRPAGALAESSPAASSEGSTILPPGEELESVRTAPARPRALSSPGLMAPEGGAVASPACHLGRLIPALAQLLDALEYLHVHGVVHQDLKPSNVLVEGNGVVRLLDFGLITAIGQYMKLRRESTIVGTPAYMSPEQWAGKPATPASDLFSLGCIMFQSLTGQFPFPERAAHVSEPPRVERWVSGVPRALSEICFRLMSASPEQRPTIAEVRAALGLGAGVSVELPSTRFVGRTRELETLRHATQRVREGGTRIVLVSGLSGVGKSALVRSFFSELRGEGAPLILRGRCYERESVPYKAFDGMIDELAVRLSRYTVEERATVLPLWFSELAKVFPVLSRIPSDGPASGTTSAMELRRRVLDGLRELLARMASKHPLVLEIDDLQWADDDSVALLTKVLESPPAGLLLVLAFRPEEVLGNPRVARYLESVARVASEWVDSISMGPLDPDDSVELARHTLISLGLDAGPAASIAEESGGIPFFLEELARSVAQQGSGASTHLGLDRAFIERVRALPESERSLVEVLSVANNPVPLWAACKAAGLEGGALAALTAVHRGHFIQSAGVRAEDRVAIYHDRMRESVIANLSPERTREHHLALGRALSVRPEIDAFAFDAVRHLGAAASLVTDPTERLASARLHLVAGRQARRAAAFPLAFRCFEGGISFLPKDAWQTQYELCLGLHVGAAEAAYLSNEWVSMERRVSEVKASARTLLDQLIAWEVELDARAGRHEYPAAIDAGLEVLRLLGVELPRDPTQAEVLSAFSKTLAGLTAIRPEGLAAMPDADDPEVVAAMRIQVRLSPAAYFAKPALLALIACNLVTTSIERGLSPATPNALAIFGIILNTADMFPISHQWGELAIKLIDRWEDRSLEAATRHVVYNLLLTWLNPLPSVLASSREVFEIGRRTGDLEYASYAAHTYVYLALYCGRPLEPLLEEALMLGRQMRALGQINAVHVHEPFEQLLKCLTGVKDSPSNLDDAEFNEARLLAAAEAEGSRSGIFILRKVMGMARFYFGRAREASALLESARPYMDAAPSCWLIPIFHQFAALSACGAWSELGEEERRTIRPKIDESLLALQRLAKHAPFNFAHRVSLIEGELCRIAGDHEGALLRFRRSIDEAAEIGWVSDIAMGHELIERTLRLLGQDSEAASHRSAARDLHLAWGARSLADRLAR